jgi:hypothetical protein
LTQEQQYSLWDHMQDDLAKYITSTSYSSSKYQVPLDASQTTRQAMKEQFMADHSFRFDLGRDLIRGGFYHCTATTTPGSIVIRLS